MNYTKTYDNVENNCYCRRSRRSRNHYQRYVLIIRAIILNCYQIVFRVLQQLLLFLNSYLWIKLYLIYILLFQLLLYIGVALVIVKMFEIFIFAHDQIKFIGLKLNIYAVFLVWLQKQLNFLIRTFFLWKMEVRDFADWKQDSNEKQ